jgi:hypothetical protein
MQPSVISTGEYRAAFSIFIFFLANKGIKASSVPSLFILFLWQVEALPSFPLQWPKNIIFFNYSFP